MNFARPFLNAAIILGLALSLSSTTLSQIAQSQDTKLDIPALQTKAAAGDAPAQLSLGLAYQNGRGVQQDDALAVEWYRKAAIAGNAEAQNDLGIMYMNGWGVEKDKTEAVRWYHIAAKQKNAHAMFNLGASYYNGDGVGVDDIKAYSWFLLAQDTGSESANDAVKRAQKELGPLSLNLGIENIADMYFKGDELNRDHQEGLRWLRKVATNGDVHAQLMLAGMLMEGTALPPNYEEAHRWCEVALRSKIALSEEHAKAAFCLGHLYRNGLGTPKNPSRALALLRQGADFGIVPAMEETADMLANGEAGKADRQEALIYLLRAMLKGDKTAQRKATDIRAQTSDQDWKKIDKEIRRRFNGSPAVLDALLESIQNPAAK